MARKALPVVFSWELTQSRSGSLEFFTSSSLFMFARAFEKKIFLLSSSPTFIYFPLELLRVQRRMNVGHPLLTLDVIFIHNKNLIVQENLKDCFIKFVQLRESRAHTSKAILCKSQSYYTNVSDKFSKEILRIMEMVGDVSKIILIKGRKEGQKMLKNINNLLNKIFDHSAIKFGFFEPLENFIKFSHFNYRPILIVSRNTRSLCFKFPITEH